MQRINVYFDYACHKRTETPEFYIQPQSNVRSHQSSFFSKNSSPWKCQFSLYTLLPGQKATEVYFFASCTGRNLIFPDAIPLFPVGLLNVTFHAFGRHLIGLNRRRPFWVTYNTSTGKVVLLFSSDPRAILQGTADSSTATPLYVDKS